MGDQEKLALFLGAVRRRLRLQGTVEAGAIVVAVGAGAALVLLCGAALLGPSAVWRTLGWLLGLGAIAGLARAVALPLAAWRRDEAVARFVGERTGTGDLFQSATELAATLPALEAEPVVSAELVRALLRAAASRARQLDVHALVDLRRARRRSGLAAAVLAAHLMTGLLLPGLWRRGFAALGAEGVALDAASEPILGDVELTFTYPKHTGLPERVIPGTSGAVLAPPGTRVDLRARALLPVDSAELMIEDGADKVLARRPVTVKAGALATSFTVAQPGGYRFAVQPPSGRAVREADLHRIDVEPDRPPRVDLAAPADDLEVAGPRRVELAWSADDDYGLGDLDLVWRAATGDEPEQRRQVRAAASGRTASGKFEWDLAELDLKPGVRVAYRLEAKDNDDVSGPNIGRSRTLHVRIYSPAEKHAEQLASEQALVDHAVSLLADRIDADRFALLPDVESAATLAPTRELDDWNGVHGKSEGFLGELGKVAAELDRDRLAPKDLKPSLIGIQERLGKLVRDETVRLRELKDRGHRLDLTLLALQPLRDGNPRHVGELERDVLLLDDLISRQRMEELLAVADAMTQARDRLKTLLEQFKKSGAESLRKEIEREIRALERKLAELAEKASRLAGDVPDEFLNREAMGDNDLGKRLDAIKEMLARGEVDQAMAELKRLSASLDKMVGAMESELKGFRGERFSAEEKALSELENKLADLEHDERQMQSDTEEVRAAQKQRAEELMRGRVEAFLKGAREQAAEIRRRIAEVDPQALSLFDQDQLDRAKRRSDDLGRALEQPDLDQGRAMAEQTAEGLEGLSRALRGREQRQWEGMKQAVRKAREQVDETAAAARKLAEEIRRILPAPGELIGPGDKKRLDDLKGRQAAARQRTEEARQSLEKNSREAGASIGDGLKQAASHMERAEEKLGRGDPQGSVGEEGQAADQLHQVREQVREQRRPRPGGAGPGAGGGSKETVKIPGADEYRAPREFRQDLLDAMKREAPKDYKEQVKRYYEELVR
ncbi:MAG: DUF4175 family protein [Myxococcales bacterium]|nr:DUF4175 family protein [Myxococcales bacterium]